MHSLNHFKHETEQKHTTYFKNTKRNLASLTFLDARKGAATERAQLRHNSSTN